LVARPFAGFALKSHAARAVSGQAPRTGTRRRRPVVIVMLVKRAKDADE
jgi:hypothetical protein